MGRVSPTRVLILVDQASGSPQLVGAVARRAAESPCTFTLLVPASAPDLGPEDDGSATAEERLELALPLLSEAAGQPLVGVIGSHEPVAAVQDALNLLGFDEVIISMPRRDVSRWLDLDLARRVRALGVPVFEVIGVERDVTNIPAA